MNATQRHALAYATTLEDVATVLAAIVAESPLDARSMGLAVRRARDQESPPAALRSLVGVCAILASQCERRLPQVAADLREAARLITHEPPEMSTADPPISLERALAELVAWREYALSLHELSELDPDCEGAARIKAAERRHKSALAGLRDLGIDVDQVSSAGASR